MGTACLCGRVNLMSVGRRRGWEGFEKGSDVATAVLGAVRAGPRWEGELPRVC